MLRCSSQTCCPRGAASPCIAAAPRGVSGIHPAGRVASNTHTCDQPTLGIRREADIVCTALSFAHTVGEFGVVLMIGGNIPDKTRVVSTQIYGHVEALEYAQAHTLSAAMLVFSFVVLLALAALRRTSDKVGM